MSRGGGLHLREGEILDLEAGLLDAAARAGALEHLRACGECEALLREVHADAERLALRPMPRGLEAAGFTTPGVARDRPAAPAPARRRILWGAVAASIMLAVAIPALLRRAPADGLDVWLPVEDDLLLSRSGAPVEDDAAYREAIDAYRRHDTRQVIALLDQRTIPPEYAPLNLLLASAHEREGGHARARAVLERLDVDTLPQPARDQARWIRYCSLVREGRDDAARQVARDLAQGTSELAVRARAALDAR